MKKILLYGNYNRDARHEVERIVSGIADVEIFDSDKLPRGDASALEGVNMALSVGGDGTFLRTAALIGNANVPILGINAGHLGFLADVPLSEAADVLPAIISQAHYTVERRSLLQLDIPDCRQHYQRHALNEVAILKRDQSSMVSVSVYVDGLFLNRYDADGLTIATPTGSTAYAMSAGGPILEPQSANWVIVPIAPHSLTTRPLVLRDTCRLELRVESRNNIFLVAVDGTPLHLTTQSRLIIEKADYSIGVVRRPERTFYDTLREKLMWGAKA